MENKFIYLDNAATTKPCAEAVNAFLNTVENFGNPSSLYGIGLAAEKLINSSAASISSMMGVDRRDIYFTSGGTEANNTAVFGTAYGHIKLGKRVITSKIEHPSVLECFKRLEREGFDVKYIGTDSGGVLNIDELDDALTEDTTLVSVMHVNNETGVIQPVDKIKQLMRKKSPRALLHCDCVQSFCKLPVEPKKWGADLISISAHKIHGFKGTGALYIKQGANIKPLLFGGEQQREFRPGTENVGGISAFGAAAEAYKYDEEKMRAQRSAFADALAEKTNGSVQINGFGEYNSGSVLNVSFDGIKAEILLHALEAKGIYVSTGSACSSHDPSPSHVLQAMNVEKRRIEGAIRISFSEALSESDFEYAADTIAAEAAKIKKYM